MKTGTRQDKTRQDREVNVIKTRQDKADKTKQDQSRQVPTRPNRPDITTQRQHQDQTATITLALISRTVIFVVKQLTVHECKGVVRTRIKTRIKRREERESQN